MVQPALSDLKNWRFHVDVERLGWLTMATPGSGVNTLSREAISELEILVARFEDMASSQELAGVILLSGKPSGFIAGADISEFDAMSDASVLPEALRRTHAVFQRIENLRVPMVAGIHGFCLGGGLELALACHYRVAVDNSETRIGFPEVKLGIFPGFGGTGRSIRQAGPVQAMTLMLSSRLVSARAAKDMNLVDKLVRHRDMLRWQARRAILQKRVSRPAGLMQRAMARIGPVRRYLAEKMRSQTAKKVNEEHYPAPFALIDLFERHGGDPAAMIRGEIEAFVPLMDTETAANLRRVFFLSEGLKRQGDRAARFTRVHVIGAGVMGGDIAAWCALRGMAVTLQDLDMEAIKPALERARTLFKKRLKKPAEIDNAMARLIADPTGKGVSRADVVIEAVVENLEIKRQIFAAAEPRLKPGAILASNTSSIELERMAEGLTEPGRLIGLHFFNPVAQLPLVEVIRSRYNDDAAIRQGASFVLAIGKSPVVVKSAPGFLVNRVLMPYMLGAVERVERGEDREMLDAAAVAFGMPMGPIELLDTVGLDVGLAVARELGHAVPENSRFAALVRAGKLGRKTGQGFYAWDQGRAQKSRGPQAEPSTPQGRASGAGKGGAQDEEAQDEEAIRKARAAAAAELVALGRDLVQPLIAATQSAVDEGVVDTADLADIGVILGTGFAPFLGGPLKARRDAKA